MVALGAVARKNPDTVIPEILRFCIHFTKQKPLSGAEGFFYLMPGSSLLSHGEAPHYHRRYGVSLL
ncbi:hypothetical protein, partial [Cronobacter sakazakii]